MNRLIKLSLSFAVALVTMIAVAAVPSTLDDQIDALNAEVADLLAPFQNASTKAELNFLAIRSGPIHTLNVALEAIYVKLGAKAPLTIALDKASYHYGHGRRPFTTVRGSASIDLTKLLAAPDLNELLANLETLIPQYAQDFLRAYGDAISIDAKVTDKKLDAEGNYSEIKLSVRIKFNFSRLPMDKKVEDQIIKSLQADILINAQTGGVVTLSVVSNPKYKGFDKDKPGIRQLLNRLLAKDPELTQRLTDYARQFDDIVGMVLN